MLKKNLLLLRAVGIGLALIAVTLSTISVLAATWQGEWGNGGNWTNGPVRWCLSDPADLTAEHPSKSWTVTETRVVSEAIREWETLAISYGVRISLTRVMSDSVEDCDVSIRWEDGSFFKDWSPDGEDLSNSNGYWLGPPASPAPWITAAGLSVISYPLHELYINEDAKSPDGSEEWFVDPTPNDDNEFVQDVPLGHPRPALTSSFAYSKSDLLTVIKHEFGHALGLTHSELTTSLMYGGGVGFGYRDRDAPVGFSERRHPTEADAVSLKQLYDITSVYLPIVLKE